MFLIYSLSLFVYCNVAVGNLEYADVSGIL